MTEEKKPKPRGFAAMSVEQRRRIASNGGKTSQAGGRAHRFTSDEARAAVMLREDRKKE